MSTGLLETNIAGLFGPDFMRRLDAELRWEIPREKLRHYEQAARAKRAEELAIKVQPHVDGLGQHVLRTPMRTWMRWKQIDPDFWKDEKNIWAFRKDSPECRPT